MNWYSNYGYILTACAMILTLFACVVQKEGMPTVKLGESFTVGISDSVRVEDGKEDFWVSVAEIQDNRCPKDVNCITGGKASVQLKVEDQPAALKFCTGSDCFGEQNNSFLVEYNNKRYTIVLEEVTPYPESTDKVVKRKAIFKIKQA